MPSQIIVGALNLAFVHACTPRFRLDDGLKKDCPHSQHPDTKKVRSLLCLGKQRCLGGSFWRWEDPALSALVTVPCASIPKVSSSDKPATAHGRLAGTQRMQPIGRGAALPCHGHNALVDLHCEATKPTSPPRGPGKRGEASGSSQLQGKRC